MILQVVERKAFAVIIFGIPLLISGLISKLFETLTTSTDEILPLSELLEDEIKLGGHQKSQIQEPILLWWTNFASVSETREKSCSLGQKITKCIISKHKELLNHPMTKAIIFYGSDFDSHNLPLPRRGDHDWALFHEESPKNKFLLDHPPILTLFNHSSTFRSRSDLPLTLQHLEDQNSLVDGQFVLPLEVKNEMKSRENLAPIIYIQSNCDNPSQRDEFVSKLNDYIPIDSYGECLNNKSPPRGLKNRGYQSRTELLKLISQYKFMISIENSICKDYVTEKLWNPLQAGTVPIYFGAPNIADFLPNEDSAILIQNFHRFHDLVQEIHDLDDNSTAYKQKLRHKEMYNYSGPLISNESLVKRLKERQFGVNENDIEIAGNFVENFECLICNRVTENWKMKKIGFSSTLPYRVNTKEMTCGPPKTVLGHFDDQVSEDNFWPDHYAQTLAEAFHVKHSVILGIQPKELSDLMNYEFVRNFVSNFSMQPEKLQHFEKMIENNL